MPTPDDSLAWVEMSTPLRHRLGVPAVPLPVSAATASTIAEGKVDLAAVAVDVGAFVDSCPGDDVRRPVLAQVVGTLAFFAAYEFLSADEPGPAAGLLELGLRHAPDDPVLRGHLGLARWDEGRRYEGLQALLDATHAYAARGQIAPMLWILTARALAEAGRAPDALALLEDLASTRPRQPRFWDLVDRYESVVSPPV